MKGTSFEHLPRDAYGYLNLSDCIMEVVKNEYPVHYDSLCKSLAHLFGNEKVTVKVRNEVNYHLNKLGNKFTRKGDFLLPANHGPITPKLNNTRAIEYVSIEELAEAMVCVGNTLIGPTFDSLCAETKRAYGYFRNGEKISTAMKAAYSQLLAKCRIKEVDGKVIVEKI